MSEFSTPIDMLQSANEPTMDSSPIEQMPVQQPMQQMPPMQMQYNPTIPVEPEKSIPEVKKSNDSVKDVFNKRAQYELMYIIIAGIILNSDMIQKLLIRNIPMLFNTEGNNTLFGTVFQTAILGIIFIILRHFTSV